MKVRPQALIAPYLRSHARAIRLPSRRVLQARAQLRRRDVRLPHDELPGAVHLRARAPGRGREVQQRALSPQLTVQRVREGDDGQDVRRPAPV